MTTEIIVRDTESGLEMRWHGGVEVEVWLRELSNEYRVETWQLGNLMLMAHASHALKESGRGEAQMAPNVQALGAVIARIAQRLMKG